MAAHEIETLIETVQIRYPGSFLDNNLVFIVMIKLKDLLTESKQSIINLGYPEIIARIFYEKFGNKAFLLARWFKEYHANRDINNKDWWRFHFGGFGTLKLNDYVDLYNSTINFEEYEKMLKHLDLVSQENINHYGDEYYLKEQRVEIKKEIEKILFNNVFFAYYFSIVNDIISGKLRDVKPYEKMSFLDASLKYDERKIFQETKPIKKYRNGFKWISVGRKCYLMGHYMKNCGSAGVMSLDADATMIGLFDVNNKPHVVVVYSPNENRIGGDEGVASTEVKSEYHKYIMDLAWTLKAEFDSGKTKSKFLKLKYKLKDTVKSIKKINAGKTPSYWNEYFRIVMKDGKAFYSNGYVMVSEEDIKKVLQLVKSGEIKLRRDQRNIIRYVFGHYNADELKSFGITYTVV